MCIRDRFRAAENCPKGQSSCCCDCGGDNNRIDANNYYNYKNTLYGDGDEDGDNPMHIIYHGTGACGARSNGVGSNDWDVSMCGDDILKRSDVPGTIIWGTSSDINLAIKWANNNINYTQELLGQSISLESNIKQLDQAYYGTTDNNKFRCKIIEGEGVTTDDLYLASGAIFNTLDDCNKAMQPGEDDATSLVNPNLTNPCCEGNCWPKNVISSANDNPDCICIAGNANLSDGSTNTYISKQYNDTADPYFYDDNYFVELGWFENDPGNYKANPDIGDSPYWVWAGYATNPAEIFNFSSQDGDGGAPKFGGRDTNKYRHSSECVKPLSVPGPSPGPSPGPAPDPSPGPCPSINNPDKWNNIDWCKTGLNCYTNNNDGRRGADCISKDGGKCNGGNCDCNFSTDSEQECRESCTKLGENKCSGYQFNGGQCTLRNNICISNLARSSLSINSFVVVTLCTGPNNPSNTN